MAVARNGTLRILLVLRPAALPALVACAATLASACSESVSARGSVSASSSGGIAIEHRGGRIHYDTGRIDFSFGKAELAGDETFRTLTGLRDYLRDHPDVSVEIVGHTDSRGAAEVNRPLSQARARAIRLWLIAHGIDGARLTERGQGEDAPEVPEPKECAGNDHGDATVCERYWSENRRPVFRVTAGAEPAPTTDGIPARVGFQGALRVGYAIPFGQTSGSGSDMADVYGGQLSLTADLGAKLTEHIFVGGYLGFGFGGVGEKVRTICDAANADCSGSTVRIGAELQYHFAPAATWNPWIGYGLGFESSSISISGGGQSGKVSASGIELAHLMFGVDYRASRLFGLGPFIDLSVGRFSNLTTELPGQPTQDGSIDSGAFHEWLTLGVRGVLFP